MQQATAFEHSIDDRGGKIVVVQDGAPCVRMLVGREDHRALSLMAMVDHVVEDVRGVGPVGQVADLVNDEDVRRGIALERARKAAEPFWIAR